MSGLNGAAGPWDFQSGVASRLPPRFSLRPGPRASRFRVGATSALTLLQGEILCLFSGIPPKQPGR